MRVRLSKNGRTNFCMHFCERILLSWEIRGNCPKKRIREDCSRDKETVAVVI